MERTLELFHTHQAKKFCEELYWIKYLQLLQRHSNETSAFRIAYSLKAGILSMSYFELKENEVKGGELLQAERYAQRLVTEEAKGQANRVPRVFLKRNRKMCRKRRIRVMKNGMDYKVVRLR